MIALVLFLNSAFAIDAPTVAPTPQSKEIILGTVLNEQLIYALRDPFKVPPAALLKSHTKAELETYMLQELRLTGVVTGPSQNVAIVVTPDQKTFFVKRMDKIGVNGGHVVSIRPQALLVEEKVMGKDEVERYEIQIDGKVVSSKDPDFGH